MAYEPELIVFDMEGTIFQKNFEDSKGRKATNAWQIFADELGEEVQKARRVSYERWKNGDISYLTWIETTARLHQRYGLDKEFFDTVIESVPYRDGVGDALQVFQDLGIRTAIVTGGLHAQANRVKQDYAVDHVFAACEYYWSDTGELDDWNILPAGHHGKRVFVEQLAENYGIKPQSIAFVGDGPNDVPLAEFADGPTVAVDAHPALRDVADIHIDTDAVQNTFHAVQEIVLQS